MGKSTLPNFFTFSNLACGIISLLMTFQNNYKTAAIFIIIAGLIDRYDGRIARFLDVSSEIGKELDSLADLVSFGVAPSILAYYLYHFSSLGIIGYVLVLIFPICGAYRLARFNSTMFHDVFMGVPITVTGSFLALYALITISYPITTTLAILLIPLLSYLMVCKLKFKKI